MSALTPTRMPWWTQASLASSSATASCVRSSRIRCSWRRSLGIWARTGAMTALLVLRRWTDASALVRHGLPGLGNGLVTGLVGGPSAPAVLLVSWLHQLRTAKEAKDETSRGHPCHPTLRTAQGAIARF